MIYVDELRDYGWKFGKSCHMTTDGPAEELHTFAGLLGLKRSHFQAWPKSSIDHYDLTESKRTLAVKFKAVELGRRESALHYRAWHNARRESGRLTEVEQRNRNSKIKC